MMRVGVPLKIFFFCNLLKFVKATFIRWSFFFSLLTFEYKILHTCMCCVAYQELITKVREIFPFHKSQ